MKDFGILLKNIYSFISGVNCIDLNTVDNY